MTKMPSIREPVRFYKDVWNVFVPQNAPQYEGLFDLVKRAKPNEFCRIEGGMWVPYGWLVDKKKNGRFRRLNGVHKR